MELLPRGAMAHAALGVEMLAVAGILSAILLGTGRFLLHLPSGLDDAYRVYKQHLAKALLLGLEFLVAADIVRTVALDATLTNVGILGALVVVPPSSVGPWSSRPTDVGHGRGPRPARSRFERKGRLMGNDCAREAHRSQPIVSDSHHSGRPDI